MMRIIGALLMMLFSTSGFALSPPAWQIPEEGSGHTWSGWTWSSNVDSYGTRGWIGQNPVDMGGGDWVPRIFEKDDYGSRCDGSIDSTVPPYRTSGKSLKIYSTTAGGGKYNAMFWLYDRNKFSVLNYTDDTTNRFDYYLKVTGTGWYDPVLRGSNEVEYNMEVGTYTCKNSCPREGSDGWHYYHLLALHAGGWYHVQLNEHPSHSRGENGNAALPNDPFLPKGHYFASMSQFYIETGYQTSSSAISYNVSDFAFSTKLNENEGIGYLAVGYFPASGKWEISYSDMSFTGTNPYNGNAKSKFDIRYSYDPITAENFSTATQIVPLFNKVVSGTNNYHRHDGWHKNAWTDFSLPADALNQQKVYFAMKDVSKTADGDNHNAPTFAIRTIDYNLGTGVPALRIPSSPQILGISP